MVAHQTVPDNFSITTQSLSELIGRALFWGENNGPVILFCGPILAQALMDFDLDEIWVELLPNEPIQLNSEIVEIGQDRIEIPLDIMDKITACIERHETLDKLLNSG